MIKKNPQLNKNIVNKCPSNRIRLGHSFAIREGLLRINKRRLIENTAGNENGYRFHSYDSQVFPTIRTQSTTIPNYASPNRLYIYKKWKCVESLTIPGKGVALSKRWLYIGYITFTQRLLNITNNQSIRGGRKFTLIRIARCNGWAG